MPGNGILVTGAGGSIGARLRAQLEQRGVPASFVLSPRSAGGQRGHEAVDVADVTDEAAMRNVVVARAPRVIIHLASVTGADCEADAERAWAVNASAASSLARTAAENGVSRFVLASSAAVYGDARKHPVAESDSLALDSVYASTKRSAEESLEELVRVASNFSAVALRIFNVFGPGMTGSLVNRLVGASSGSPVQLAGLDTFVRDYVHVDDVAEALQKATEADLPESWAIMNIGSGTPTSNRQLVELLEPVFFVEGTVRHSYSCADVTRAREMLGFEARRPLERASVH